MNTTPLCPSCGKTLAPSAPKGLCQECLLKAGFPTDDPTNPKASAFIPPTPEELAPRFPQLEILELVGRGGMGAVYKARQIKLDRIVALKILPPTVGEDPAFAERFTREAKALAKLNHPGIVTLYEFGESDGLFFFLMEFVDGLNLRRLLQGGRVAPREALAIVPQICDALQYAHDSGIVHRDIKPENILMDRRGRVKVADFGLAKLMGVAANTGLEKPTEWQGGKPSLPGEVITDAGKVMGTPSYMAPEQMDNPTEVDHRADIYALGVVFYQMLTGELPGKRIEAPSKKVHIDVRLDEVVLRALEREPDRRYEQASFLKTEVENIASSPSGSPPLLGKKSDSQQDAKAIEEARSQVKVPAIGLMIAGLLNMLPLLVLFLFLGSQMASGPGTKMRASFALVLLPVIPLIGAFIVFGARRMMQLRSYGLCVAASIVAMITPPGFLVGLPLGIWALIVLSRREVREAFELKRRELQGAQSDGGQGFSRKAIAGAAWASYFFIVLIGYFKVRFLVMTPEAVSLAPVWRILFFIAMLLGILAPLRTTILGYVAISQIRRSGGRIYGMGLAVFDVLLFPLLLLFLVLNLAFASLYLLWGTGMKNNPMARDYSELIRYGGMAAQVLVWIGLSILIIRWTWRRVNRPLARPERDIDESSSQSKSESAARSTGTTGQPLSTWSAFQSAQAQEICTHLTRSEKNQASLLMLLFSAWIMGTVFGVAYFIRSFPGVGPWIVAMIWIILAVVSVPLFYDLYRRFLASTEWAKNHQVQPGHIKLFSFRAGNWSKVAVILVIGGLFIYVQKKAVVQYTGISDLSKSLEKTRPAGRRANGSSFIAKYDQGTVELLALAPHPSTNGPAWLPNGDFASEPFPFRDGAASSRGNVMKEIAFRIRSESRSASYPVTRYETNSGVDGMGGSYSKQEAGPNARLFVGRLACSPGSKETSVQVGVADGPWEEVITLEIGPKNLNNSSAESGEKGSWEAGFKGVIGKAGDVALSLNYTKSDEWETRMVAFQKNGTMGSLDLGRNDISGGMSHQMALLSAEKFAELEKVQLQRRKYQWVEFRNISMKPGHRTVVQVKDVVDAKAVADEPAGNDPALLEEANQPPKLRSLPTARVIRVGMSHPEIPWAWMELKERIEKKKISRTEADAILIGLTGLMRQHPNGYGKPLNWIDSLIVALRTGDLISEAKVLEFVQAVHGGPTLRKLPRLRAGENTTSLLCEWKSVWHSDLFGFVLLNEMRSIKIDGQPVESHHSYEPKPYSWSQNYFRSDLQLPPLAPGRHVVRCEVFSALIPTSDMTGLSDNTAAKDWPPAKVQWTRPVEAELMVYEKDASLVRLTEDPSLNPGLSNGLSVERIIVRRSGELSTAVVAFKMSDTVKVPIAFDVALRMGGETYKCGYLWKGGESQSPMEFTVGIKPLAVELQEADVVLTPNPKLLDSDSTVQWIWGKEMSFKRVPVVRQDLANTASKP